MLRCTTYSDNLDTLLAGGIETQAVTEFYGEYGSGKTQSAIRPALRRNYQSIKKDWVEQRCTSDTESTFRPERVAQIAKARNLDVDSVLNNIHVAKVYNASHLELIVRAIGGLIQQNNIKLVIVDSIIRLAQG